MKRALSRKLKGSLSIKLIGLAFVFFASSSFAQKWMNFGVSLGYQGNKIMNSQLKADETLSAKFGFNPHFGLNLTLNTNEFFGVSFEAGYAKVTSILSYLSPDTVFDYQGARKIMFNSIDAGLIFKIHTPSGGYIEAGPKYTLVQTVVDIEKNSLYQVDATDHVTGYASVVFGLGILAFKKERTNISLGFRGEYGLTDMISGAGKEVKYPTYRDYGKEQSEYRLLTGMFVVNLSYDIGILNASRQTYRYPYFKVD